MKAVLIFIFLTLILLNHNVGLAQKFELKTISKCKPENLEETNACLSQSIVDDSTIYKITSKEFVEMFHRSLGLNIRNEWSLFKKRGNLVNYFNSFGIMEPDDMSVIILLNFYYRYRGVEIDGDIIKKYISKELDYWWKIRDLGFS